MSKQEIGGFLEKDDVVLYFDVRRNNFIKAIIVCVHRDDKIPYFTIRTTDKELQTTAERLFVHAAKKINE
tara:strand:- start:567 stop:776 length:210 start_codon:yes stop_codon:yes gene_type:complete